MEIRLLAEGAPAARINQNAAETPQQHNNPKSGCRQLGHLGGDNIIALCLNIWPGAVGLWPINRLEAFMIPDREGEVGLELLVISRFPANYVG